MDFALQWRFLPLASQLGKQARWPVLLRHAGRLLGRSTGPSVAAAVGKPVWPDPVSGWIWQANRPAQLVWLACQLPIPTSSPAIWPAGPSEAKPAWLHLPGLPIDGKGGTLPAKFLRFSKPLTHHEAGMSPTKSREVREIRWGMGGQDRTGRHPRPSRVRGFTGPTKKIVKINFLRPPKMAKFCSDQKKVSKQLFDTQGNCQSHPGKLSEPPREIVRATQGNCQSHPGKMSEPPTEIVRANQGNCQRHFFKD